MISKNFLRGGSDKINKPRVVEEYWLEPRREPSSSPDLTRQDKNVAVPSLCGGHYMLYECLIDILVGGRYLPAC
jgi:hypothetical protein